MEVSFIRREEGGYKGWLTSLDSQGPTEMEEEHKISQFLCSSWSVDPRWSELVLRFL